jgi:molecular chaperone GrpE
VRTPENPSAPVPPGTPPVGGEAPTGPFPTGHPADSPPTPEQEASGPSPTGHPESSHPTVEETPTGSGGEAVPEPGVHLREEPLLPDDLVGEGEGAGEGASAVRNEDVSAVDEAVEEAEEAIAEDVSELAQVSLQRDEYLDQLRRLQADFENYKKRIVRQQTEHIDRATEELVTHLLPALDNFDLALAHGTEGLEPVYRSLLDILEGAGLQRVDPLGQPFDPNEHDAALHEEAEGAEGVTPEVVEVLRAGYRWKGRVLRPAMVKVKG